MGFDDVLDDGQTQSRTTRVPGAAFVDAVEALVNAVEVLFGNADAVVFNRDANGFAFGFQAQCALPSFFAVVNRIDQEVGQDLANLNRAAEDVEAFHSGFGQFEADVNAHFQGLGLNAVDGLLARINDVARCEGEGEAV